MYFHYKGQLVKAVYAETVAISFKNHTREVNGLRGQELESVNRIPSGTYSDD